MHSTPHLSIYLMVMSCIRKVIPIRYVYDTSVKQYLIIKTTIKHTWTELKCNAVHMLAVSVFFELICKQNQKHVQEVHNGL